MPGFFQSLMRDYRLQVERRRNRQFLDATMAACSLIAIADGEVTLAERIRVDRILETLEELKVFDPHEGVNLFNDYCRAIQDSPKEGREKAVRSVKSMAGDPETAELLIRICLAIAESRGEKPLVDQVEIVMLCSLLGVDPEQRGLYVDAFGEDSPAGRS